jgi:hypothetical protein
MPDLPGWMIYALGVVTGALLMLGLGPASDAFWEVTFWLRRAAIIVGAVVLAGAFLVAAGYLVLQAQSA